MKGCAKCPLTLGLNWHIVPYLEQHTPSFISRIENKMQKLSPGKLDDDTIIRKPVNNKDTG